MNKLRDIIYKILTHIINFLIDVRDIVDDSPLTTLSAMIRDEWGETQYCPWCDGIGLLREDGKSFSDDKDE